MKKITNLFLLAVFLFSASAIFGQGVTTSSINGKITDNNGDALPGVNVVAIHTASGTKYGSSTDYDGYFRISNMRAGGPYSITISYVGFNDHAQNNVFLQLGQTLGINHKMVEVATALGEVVITVSTGGVFDGNKTGSGGVVSKRQVETLPSVSRGIGDFLRTSPLAQVSGSQISIAGQNNRYNAIYIDGAVNNDVFGLAGSGTNGGQTGVNPISVDAIESFQIAIAPFDVKISGFAGGAISAVTKSGTNNTDGSVYGFIRNESLAGKTPVALVPSGQSREKLANFSALTYGIRASGPIVKDKLFYFINYEKQDDETPRPFNYSNYKGSTTEAGIQGLRDYLINSHGYDPGAYLSIADKLESDKFIAKLDWNINDNHKLSLKHSLVKAEQVNASTSSTTAINFSGRSIYFPTTTNTSTLELNSKLNDKISNSLTLAYTKVLDDRDPLGDPFPSVTIRDGLGTINFGSEAFSTANILEQEIITLTNNFEIQHGQHTLTFGAHLEQSNVRNVFIGENFGAYTFRTLNGFLNQSVSDLDTYRRSYSLFGGIGDDSEGAAEFDLFQMGLYFQDVFQVNNNFKFSLGVRVDVPYWPAGTVNNDFNTRTVGLLEAAGKNLQGARVGEALKTTVHLSPRFGFNWNVNGESKTQIHGGLGVFTSRVPLVWPGAMYNTNGIAQASASRTNLPAGVAFIGDVTAQPVGAAIGSGLRGGDVNIFSSDFKLPQVLKFNIAVDQKLPIWGLVASADFLYNNNLSAVYYENLNIKAPTQYQTGTGDTRPFWSQTSIDAIYRGIYLGSNTSEGYSWNSSFTLTKPYSKGFYASASYSYGDSYAIFEGTSSQNSSQWRNIVTVNGKNSKIPASRSQFALGHKVSANASYDLKWNDNIKTTFGLFYQGVNGSPFSYIYNESIRDVLNDDSRDNALIYVPKNANDIRLRDGVYGLTSAQQWDALNNFIEGDDYLRSRRGQYAELNADRAPWSHVVDLKVMQDFSLQIGEKKHTLQASFDIFNFTNLINKKWGVQKFAPNFGEVELIRTETNGVAPTYSFNPAIIENRFEIDDSGIESSRWQMQIGLRYIFN